MRQIIQEYLAVVDSIHGAYLDAITGFFSLVEEYDAAKAEMLRQRPDIPAEAFDGAALNYGTGHPRQPASRVVHSCTQGEYRQRNAEGGRNHKVMGQLCLAQMFGFWEDCYRDRLAGECGIKRNDVKLDIMGDLRLLRNSIIHHRGIAKKEIEKCKLLNWFREGEEIVLTPQHFEQVVAKLREDLRTYKP